MSVRPGRWRMEWRRSVMEVASARSEGGRREEHVEADRFGRNGAGGKTDSDEKCPDSRARLWRRVAR